MCYIHRGRWFKSRLEDLCCMAPPPRLPLPICPPGQTSRSHGFWTVRGHCTYFYASSQSSFGRICKTKLHTEICSALYWGVSVDFLGVFADGHRAVSHAYIVLKGGLSVWRGLVVPPSFASLPAVSLRRTFLFHNLAFKNRFHDSVNAEIAGPAVLCLLWVWQQRSNKV